jgi:hypothetical protein
MSFYFSHFYFFANFFNCFLDSPVTSDFSSPSFSSFSPSSCSS